MTEAELRDPEGFSTLDAKIMSALTNILEGDFARQTDTYKETEAHSGRMVRGRQLMFRLRNYFATNALHGSVYDMEDLMNCVMVNENLTTFIRNWDTILSGIPTPPDNSVLEPLFHRQIKKCKVIDHDIQVYERALEGSEQRCYEFLYKAVVNHLKRQRLQKNRDRIARQTGVPTAPAPPVKKIPKGFCVDWVKTGSCSRDKCTYKHQTPRGRSQTPGRTPTRPQEEPLAREGKARAKRRNANSSDKEFAIVETSATSSTKASLRPLLRAIPVHEQAAAGRKTKSIRKRREKAARVAKAPDLALGAHQRAAAESRVGLAKALRAREAQVERGVLPLFPQQFA